MNSKPADIVETATISLDEIMAVAPVMHRYAMKRLGTSFHADDVVQDTLERAWSARDTFRPGADVMPWLFRILRNVIVDRQRRNKRVIQDRDGVAASRLSTEPDQLWRLYYADMIVAVETLSPDQKRALLLIAGGVTNEEAAVIMGCPLGTLKSHVRLGRHKLRAAGV